MTGPEWSVKLAWVGSNPGNLRGFRTKWMKQRLEQIKFLNVTTSMLADGVPFPVIPQSAEIMNIVVPNMMQNALTKKMTVAAASDDAAATGARPCSECLTVGRRAAARRRRTTAYILRRHSRCMLLVIGYPVYYTIYLSFFNTPPSWRCRARSFVGLDNYVRILGSDAFLSVTWNTFLWTFFSTIFAFVLGFGAALALNREFVGRGLLRGILLVPYVISAVAAAYVWRWLYHSDFGVIGALAVALGITDRPINFLDNAQHGDAVADRGEHLEGVPVRDDHDAGRTADRAGPVAARRAGWMAPAAGSAFWHVTVPHLTGRQHRSPCCCCVVTNLNSFTIPWIMTGGGPAGASHIWITAIYQMAFGRIRFGPAAGLFGHPVHHHDGRLATSMCARLPGPASGAG